MGTYPTQQCSCIFAFFTALCAPSKYFFTPLSCHFQTRPFSAGGRPGGRQINIVSHPRQGVLGRRRRDSMADWRDSRQLQAFLRSLRVCWEKSRVPGDAPAGLSARANVRYAPWLRGMIRICGRNLDMEDRFAAHKGPALQPAGSFVPTGRQKAT